MSLFTHQHLELELWGIFIGYKRRVLIWWTVPLRPIEKITMWLHYCGTTPSNLCLYKIHTHISFEQKPKSKNLFLTRHSSSLGVFYSIHLQVVKRVKMGVHSETHWNVFRITTVATHVPYKTKVSLSKPHHVVQIFDVFMIPSWQIYASHQLTNKNNWELFYLKLQSHLYAFKHQAFVPVEDLLCSKQYRRTIIFNSYIYNIKYPTFWDIKGTNRNGRNTINWLLLSQHVHL